MARNIVAGIDCGSHAIKITVIEDRGTHLSPRILSITKEGSAGIKQGYINNMDLATESIYKTVQIAEKNIGMRIKRAYIGFGGVGLSSSLVEHSISVSRGDNEITDLDIKRLIEEAEDKIPNSMNLEVLTGINLSFVLDGKKVLGDPKGWRGNKLEAKILFITGISKHIQDLKTAVEKAGVAIESIVPFPLATSIVTVSPKQKESGCVIAEIGSDTVSVSIFDDSVLESVTVLPIGSMNVTEDIAIGLKIDLEEAEQIKTGVKFKEEQDKKGVKNIIDARLSDIFEFIGNHLKKTGRQGLLPAGVILTGGGALIPGITELSISILKLPSKLTSPLYPKHFLMGEDKQLEKLIVPDMSYSSSYGLAMYGLNPEYSEESVGVKIGRNTKKSILNIIRQFLP